MKSLLFVLLALSLAANVYLATRAAAPTTSTLAPVGSSRAGAIPTMSPSPTSFPARSAETPVEVAKWTAGYADHDLATLVARLRAEGCPPAVIRAVIGQLLRVRFPNPVDPNLPFWKLRVPDAKRVAAQQAVESERRALFESLLGPDARPSAVLDPETREQKYGSINNDKIDLIARIERDYSEISAEEWAKRQGNAAATSNMMTAQRMMEAEKFADIAQVLTPEELLQYEVRNSNTARALTSNLVNVDVSEQEYFTLYQARKAFDLAHPPSLTTDPNTAANRMVAQQSLNEQIRSTLGDERFYSYLQSADRNYAMVSQTITTNPPITSATAYQVYQLQNELQVAMSRANSTSRNTPPTPVQIAEIRAKVEAANTRLEALVGAKAADTYRSQGMGRVFSAFRNNPRPPSGSSGP